LGNIRVNGSGFPFNASVMWDWLEYLVSDLAALVLQRWRRFYACFLMSFAAVGFILWLVPGRSLSIGISTAVVIVGTTLGLIWESRSR